MTWLKKLRHKTIKYSLNSNIESIGDDFINRVLHAARQDNWGLRVMQLAWTAGPVTFMALQGGYLLGYGKSAPMELFVYFAIYTIIAGIVAILIRFLYQMTKGDERIKMEKALKQSFIRLPELILLTRNELLHEYDAKNRNLLTARYLLENPDSNIEAIKAAIYDITEKTELRFAIERIEIFRENGLFARIEDENLKITDELEEAVAELTKASPAVANLVKRRFAGNPPNRQTGRLRTEGFISRALSAAEKDEYLSLTLQDAEEIFTLAFELLADRDIPLFRLKYRGSEEFTKTSENLEKARLAYRQKVFQRNNKLRKLADLFSESDEVDFLSAASPTFSTIDVMYKNILLAIDSMYDELLKYTRSSPAILRTKKSISKNRIKFRKLEQAIDLHKALVTANSRLDKYYDNLLLAEKRYNKTAAKATQDFPLRLLDEKQRGHGIKIIQDHILLSKNNKKLFAVELKKLLKAFDNSKHANTIKLRKLAVDIMMLLDSSLKLGQFRIQYAIESSNASYLSSLNLNLSASAKTGMAVTLIKEIQKNVRVHIHRLMFSLVNFHKMPLDPDSIELLVNKFGADRDYLEKITPTEESAQETLNKHPAHLLKTTQLDRKYIKLIELALKKNML
ncbi:MAG: hypothetical protein PQJ61_04565 [Spirochaetales bacterium]|uniref:Uncharacterized protein n=1 Tax=Candidatus Thalassospirochaeta sargassi TaxID=3119039 RepID=A0AAJ1IEQ0_9SPIO|nr:hypothetical protein [Spirochaetales bacterium]